MLIPPAAVEGGVSGQMGEPGCQGGPGRVEGADGVPHPEQHVGQALLPIPLVREDGSDDVCTPSGIAPSPHSAGFAGREPAAYPPRCLPPFSSYVLLYTGDGKIPQNFFEIMGIKRACPRFGEGGQAFVLGIQVYS